MSATGQLRLFVLEALDRTGDEPMPESALVASVQLAHRHLKAGEEDVRKVIVGMEDDGLISSTQDVVTEQSLWVLTPKGQAAYRARAGH